MEKIVITGLASQDDLDPQLLKKLDSTLEVTDLGAEGEDAAPEDTISNKKEEEKTAPSVASNHQQHRQHQQAGVEKRIDVLASKVQKRMAALADAESAKTACLQLRELRTYLHISPESQAYILRIGFVEKLICLLSRCIDYRVLLSDAMRCIIPFVREQASKAECCELLCRYQTIKFLLVCLRRHIDDDNICIQCMELIYLIIDHSCRTGAEVSVLVNFMVMHGGMSVLPSRLIAFEAQQQEVSLRRTISC